MKPIPFKFSLLPGDLINALAGVKAACEKSRNQAALYLGLNFEWQMVDDLKIGRKSPFTLTKESMEFLRPLLLDQPYIRYVDSLEEAMPDIYHGWCDAVETKDPQTVADWYRTHPEIIDLDKHHCYPIGLPYGNIFRSNFYMYPDMACDLSKPWIQTLEPIWEGGPIIINRTLRCRNSSISYRFLKEYDASAFTFVGHHDEFLSFCDEGPGRSWDCNFLTADNAKDLAECIAQCRFFIGNQSLCFSLAEAMKVPRILEVCPDMPNVIGSGPGFYDFYYQSAFEYYVKQLING